MDLSIVLQTKIAQGAIAGFAVAFAVDLDALRASAKANGIGGVRDFLDHFNIRVAGRRWVIGVGLGILARFGLSTQGVGTV